MKNCVFTINTCTFTGPKTMLVLYDDDDIWWRWWWWRRYMMTMMRMMITCPYTSGHSSTLVYSLQSPVSICQMSNNVDNILMVMIVIVRWKKANPEKQNLKTIVQKITLYLYMLPTVREVTFPWHTCKQTHHNYHHHRHDHHHHDHHDHHHHGHGARV